MLSAGATVTDLQRELLAIARGLPSPQTLSIATGAPQHECISLRRQISTDAQVLELRRRIHALDPHAVLYWTWWGGRDARAEFEGLIARERASGVAA